MAESFDCIVLGGGPAGSTAATLLADAGLRTLLLERDKFPRFHVGESLMPETYWTFERLGLLEKLKQSAFPKKYSVQFVNHRGRESAPFYFLDEVDHECSVTWQVRRSDFDKLMFDNAAEKGAVCRDETRVLEVLFDGDKAVGARAQSKGGPPEEFSARVVVDATGQQSLIANRFGLREQNERLRKASIWTYYRGAHRDTGVDEGATVILHTTDKKCWFWYIPLLDDTVSVGVVGDVDDLLRSGKTPEETFLQELENCPAVKERVSSGERIDDYHVTRDFSYVCKQPAGEGWVLVGDALGFLDPIYSSGVFLALKSGEMAADAIIEGFGKDDLSGEQLGQWSGEFFQGMELIRKLVYAFYNEQFSFGRFIRDYPDHKSKLVDLLVGRIYKPGLEQVFDDMETWLAQQQT